MSGNSEVTRARRVPVLAHSTAVALVTVLVTALVTGCVADVDPPVSPAGGGTSAAPPSKTPTAAAVPQPSSDPTGPAATADQVYALGWRGVERPADANVALIDDPTSVSVPWSPSGAVLRVSLAPGELYTNGASQYSRAEVYGRVATEWSDAPADWLDPPGSVRYYSFALSVASDFPRATSNEEWLDLTQWKGRDGGSPPVALEVVGDRLTLGGASGSSAGLPDDGDLGPLPRGCWTELTVGLRLSPDPARGWVEVSRDGRAVLPRTPLATMDSIDGSVDPVFLKQGIYRSHLWSTSTVAYFGPVTVTQEDPRA